MLVSILGLIRQPVLHSETWEWQHHAMGDTFCFLICKKKKKVNKHIKFQLNIMTNVEKSKVCEYFLQSTAKISLIHTSSMV